MKALYHMLGLIAAFCVTFVVLITSVEAVVYFNDGYFEEKYTKYNVLERVHMEMDDLLYVTDEMMDYLKGEREDLVVNTIVDVTDVDCAIGDRVVLQINPLQAKGMKILYR